VVGFESDSNVLRKYGLGARNERGSRVDNFCYQNNFVTKNTFFEVPLRKLYKKQVKYNHSFPGAEIDSDHKLVMMKCWVTLKKSKKQFI